MQPISPKRYRDKNNNFKRKFFSSFMIVLILAGLLACGWFVLQIFNPLNLQITRFTINEGEGVNQISYHLKQQGVIRSSFVFETYVYLKGIEGNFKASNYILPHVINIKRLTEILTTGQTDEEWKLTIPEGWTINDIAFKLESLGKFQAEELFDATGFNQPKNKIGFDISDYDFLTDLPKGANLEGYLFPDTYHYFAYATIDDVVRKMLNNFNKKLTPQMRHDIKQQGKTIFDIITLASIIEREVKTDQDRPIVAGIFWHRLAIGMPLQADSTINYITHKKTPAVSSADLELDSLYNTYKHRGLPPGPISNPGIESIKAAIYPKTTNYLYFLTDNNGRVYYAKTFEQHIENKNKYL